MAFAIVDLRWTPPQFWAATPHELWSAVEMIEQRVKSRQQGN
jgi:hypothetical protein